MKRNERKPSNGIAPTRRAARAAVPARGAKAMQEESAEDSSRACCGEFAEMENLPGLERYADAFRKATGLPFLKLVPPDHHKPYLGSGKEEKAKAMAKGKGKAKGNPLCYLVRHSGEGCRECLENQRSLLQRAGEAGEIRHANCAVGLTEFAIPVMEGKRHVATLVSGQVFMRKPTERDFERVAKRLSGGKGKQWIARARKAFFGTPVIPADRIRAIIGLLDDFARHIPEDARRHVMASAPAEHRAVRSAKEFITASAGKHVTLGEVLHHVHVSRFHFCKIFKQNTGFTLTGYMTRFRLEKAKTLLLDPSLRVSDVVFAAGFGSVAQFNSVFRRLVKMSPTEYRALRRAGERP